MSLEFRNAVLAPLNGISVVAPPGVIIGVIGEKGSGVAELLKLVGGAAQPESGEVRAGPERRYVALGDSLNLAPAAVIALDQALASHEGSVRELMCEEIWWVDCGHIAAKGDPQGTLAKHPRPGAGRIRAWGE